MKDMLTTSIIVRRVLKIVCIVQTIIGLKFVILGTILLNKKNVSPVPPPVFLVLDLQVIAQPATLILFS